MLIKTCTQCKLEKQITEYRRDKSRVDGRTSHCKQCARALQSKRYRESYAATRAVRDKNLRDTNKVRIQEIKKRGCSCCSEKEPICLDFHHRDPTQKDFEIASTTRTWSYIEAEINKCVLVCKNCHTKIHAGIIACP